ncbi:hypothetical protein BTN76_07285 [Salmonella enterica subsp. enterica serovar Enteritidis]|uniref:Uncharacterized protein n=7 Tax=Salmonella enteritidis TaxID=149539 RepID=A0A656IA26_SALE2|nr:hypothetical protein AV70_32700 [Salmonella enterica subsp. enterica serovar Enteritidis str. EC20121175]AIM83829.1 hypothetical protein IY69_10150 [Salmonella enterica subsp. enterica serovar Enteritidis]AKG77029.1 hypothetical protein SEE18569_08715 [Salmonella enterica subsp. enterica serovar Enteritidis str. 18569]AKR14316.1 hypothetical protein AU29_26170 [Salmonella enterica subsp. enterica serovar Enteritidis str. EC20090641]AKR14473.1 hypothetical protein AU44_26465 [Salmonella enter
MPRHGATLSVIAQVKCCDLTAMAMCRRLMKREKLAGTWQIILRHNAVEIKGRGQNEL